MNKIVTFGRDNSFSFTPGLELADGNSHSLNSGCGGTAFSSAAAAVTALATGTATGVSVTTVASSSGFCCAARENHELMNCLFSPATAPVLRALRDSVVLLPDERDDELSDELELESELFELADESDRALPNAGFFTGRNGGGCAAPVSDFAAAVSAPAPVRAIARFFGDARGLDVDRDEDELPLLDEWDPLLERLEERLELTTRFLNSGGRSRRPRCGWSFSEDSLRAGLSDLFMRLGLLRLSAY